MAYEPSIRVPLLIYDPRTEYDQQGSALTKLVLNIDLPETILDLAGIDIPRSMQGRSLLPLLNGELQDWREDIFIEHSFTFPPSVVIPPHEGLRTVSHKYIHYLEQDYEELYYLQLDPFETSNLATEPAHQDQLAALRQRTAEFKQFCNTAELVFRNSFEPELRALVTRIGYISQPFWN